MKERRKKYISKQKIQKETERGRRNETEKDIKCVRERGN
jgi:hypothetical protein